MFSDWFQSLWSFRGRNGRARYWSVFVASLAMLMGVSGLITAATGQGEPDIVLSLLALPIMIACLVASWFNAVKRLHDLGRSGWWLLPIIFVIAPFSLLSNAGGGLGALAAMIAAALDLILIVVLGAVPGQPGPNRFGPPAAMAVEKVFD